jgi:1,4-dihydroxy-2-naphthoate octaprenyltransferase
MMSLAAPPAPAGYRIWLLAIRPRTLPAAVGPIFVGTAVAIDADRLHAPSAFVALLVALLLQIIANLANDVFDFRRGADAARLGPTRVTQSGLLAPERVLAGTILVIGLAIACGLYLVWRGGWPILALGLASILAAVAYTGGPFPLGYHGLGDLFAFVFFGFVGVAGSAYLQIGSLTWPAIVAAVPIGCLVAAIIVVNNLRDRETDAAAGKRTLAVRMGTRATIGEYRLLLVVAYAIPVFLWLGGELSGWWWIPWLSLPLAARLVREIGTTTGRALNPVLGRTAQLSLIYSLLFAIAMVM